MGVLWVLVVLLILFAVNSWLWVILVVALILLLVGVL